MNPHVRNGLLGLLILTSPLAACARPNDAAAPTASAPAVVGSIAQSSAPQIVTGLPDFTRLVEVVGPGVVNITAKTTPKKVRMQNVPPGMGGDDDDMPEFFRRFFGPGFPQPGQSRGGMAMGSGFIISPDGYVLTNRHVVDGADTVTVKLSDKREFKAKVVGSDEQYDVAVLKIDAKDLPSVRIGNSDQLKPGQWAVAIGSPFGLDHSVTAGIISAVGRSTPENGQQYVPFIQTDVAINPGNSGGPLLNTSGEVVGINSQIFSRSGGYMGVSFAIPINLAVSAADQIKKTGKVSRAQLGAYLQELDGDKAKAFGLPDERGALIREVVPGSPAEKAGLQQGDVVRTVNGKSVDSSAELPPLIAAMAPGSKVGLGVWRDGKLRTLDATLGAQDAAMAGGPGNDAEALLGLSLADLDPAQRKQAGGGVQIVDAEGPAAEARLQPGLVITRVGRTPVNSVAEFDKAIAGTKPGSVVMLLVRDPRGRSSYVTVTAGDGSDDEGSDDSN